MFDQNQIFSDKMCHFLHQLCFDWLRYHWQKCSPGKRPAVCCCQEVCCHIYYHYTGKNHGEKLRKKLYFPKFWVCSVFLSKWVFFVKMGKTIFPFWEKYSFWEKYRFCQCTITSIHHSVEACYDISYAISCGTLFLYLTTIPYTHTSWEVRPSKQHVRLLLLHRSHDTT